MAAVAATSSAVSAVPVRALRCWAALRSSRPVAFRSPSPGSGSSGQLPRGARQVVYGRRSSSRLAAEMEELEAEEKRFAPDVTKLEWKSPLTLDSIEKYPSPVLRAPNGRITTFDDDLKKLAAEMLEVMYQDDGVGLAAPQVGVNVQLMVFNPEGVRGQGQEFILCNPRIISTSKSIERGEEGCLSFITKDVHILGDVERATMVKVKAQDETGAKFQIKLEGWRARIFQHEFDHLQGKLFVDADRMVPEHRAEAIAELRQLETAFGAANPGVEHERAE